MKTINISPLQWEWLYWLTGTPQFEEECPEWDQDFIKRLRECDFCEHEFDEDLGKYGCPNCHGEGLDKVKGETAV
jgi:hypothetical protein